MLRHAPAARSFLVSSAVALVIAQPAAAQQAASATAAAASSPASAASVASAASAADKSYVIPAAEIIGFDFLLSRYNRRFSGVSDYDMSWASIKRNLRGPWVVDNDPFKINQFAHPYQGSIYHTAARATGLSYWEASAYTFAGSAWWEITGEQTPPSRNDQIASGIAGSFLGEPLFRMAHLMLGGQSRLPYAWRSWGAALVAPSVGFNRLVYGSRFDDAFNDHDPTFYGRLRVGGQRVDRDDSALPLDVKRGGAEIDYAIDYGLPGKDGYTYSRPFDYFNFRAVINSVNGMENLATRGLLVGADYALGDGYRGVWGLFGQYDYIAPQVFHLSSTALSLGTAGQWWVSRSVALQGSVAGGFGYAAASAYRATDDDKDYHYGVAPQIGLALRVISGNSVSADVNAQKFFLGRVANRSAGRDDIARVDASLTWRLSGPHALGVKYVWSHRNASIPGSGERNQTLATIGLYYTLIGFDGFGAVDWR
ncbi:MAG TPA: DUF3943 domain-containing protein [Burkholderiaceae bacterium]|nr:DUF3943 domain-containing protein [Burkholderiaceae bacterium]